jgi:hypothetical protein
LPTSLSNAANAVLNDWIIGDSLNLFLRKRQLLKKINIIAVDGAMGMNSGEPDAKITLPNTHPSKLRPEIK